MQGSLSLCCLSALHLPGLFVAPSVAPSVAPVSVCTASVTASAVFVLRACLQELFGEMMGWGVIPSVAAYEAVMEAHAQHRDLAAAEGVLDRMQAAGHQPVLRTYNRLLHGVALNGDLAAAIRVYNRQRLQGLQPDIQTMRALFKCVRLYASNVRVATARSISQANAGDRYEWHAGGCGWSRRGFKH